MSDSGRLTLGALYREMRAGLGDAGWVRVAVEFHQRAVEAALPGGGASAPPGGASLALRALIDQRDGVLDRGEIALDGPDEPRRLVVRRRGSSYAYSVDGGRRWGSFSAPPRLFDLEEFEAALDRVEVEDATIEPVRGETEAAGEVTVGGRWPVAEPRPAHALDVSLDREQFVRLLSIFSPDAQEGPDEPGLSAYSVSLEAAGDVSLLYWWSLNGREGDPVGLGAGAAGSAPRMACSVSIHVTRGREPAPDAVVIAAGLPEVSCLDEVWTLLRRAGAGGR